VPVPHAGLSQQKQTPQHHAFSVENMLSCDRDRQRFDTDVHRHVRSHPDRSIDHVDDAMGVPGVEKLSATAETPRCSRAETGDEPALDDVALEGTVEEPVAWWLRGVGLCRNSSDQHITANHCYCC